MGRKKKIANKKDLEIIQSMSGWHGKGAIATALGIHRETFNKILETQSKALEAFNKGKFEAMELVTGKLKDKIKNGCYKSLNLYLSEKANWNEEMVEDVDEEYEVITIG